MEEKLYISRVKFADNGSVYVIKDAEAREALENLFIDEFIISGGTAPTEDEDWSFVFTGGTAPLDE
jgi:hypothetical protein